MKTLLIIFLFVLCANTLQIQNIENHVVGYISKYGIPAADKLKRAEDEFLKSGLRIFGGEHSALGQLPYQVGLISEIIDTSSKSLCGGSLISTNRVLTAAHCWYDGENQAFVFEVVLGSVFVFSGGTRVRTSTVSMHPQWSPWLIRNDIAILYLPNGVAISADIAPIALPTASEIEQDFAGVQAIASGFGITQEDESVAVNQVLSHVSLKVIKNSICSIAYPFVVQTSNICTNGFGGSPCRGDSGGPLVFNSTGRNILIGVTSFGSGFGCQSLLPAVYTRVTSYLSFIYQHV